MAEALKIAALSFSTDVAKLSCWAEGWRRRTGGRVRARLVSTRAV